MKKSRKDSLRFIEKRNSSLKIFFLKKSQDNLLLHDCIAKRPQGEPLKKFLREYFEKFLQIPGTKNI